jgi:Sulfotransferase family
MLRQLLDSHPRISCGPEDISLYYLSQLDNDLWRMTLQGYGFTEAEWNSHVKELFEGLHWRYANSAGKNRWAVKCPEHSLIIEYLDKLYPDCQVIHIVRHPRDVIASNYRKYGPKKGAFYGGRWVSLVRAAETGGAQLGPERFRTIKYENLVADPERELKDLVSWLGEPWSPEVLRFGERTHSYPPRLKPHGTVAVHTRSIGKGRSRDFFQPLLYVRLHANDLLRRFGYKISLFDDHE